MAIDPKDGSAYFVINDESGCTYASGCRAELGRISSTGNLSSPIPLPTNVPGVSQMYFTNDGALWMATYQPAGAWSSPLPILRMAPGSLSEPSPLPASFGEASGFVQDPSGNLWISACTGPNCLPDHDGTPVLEETTTSSYGSGPTQAIALPTSCAHLGYLGFTVGDVAFSNGTLYVIGLNDGSAPPARGVVWTYPPSGSNSCLAVPNNFNPSPYFATIGSPSNSTLVFGAGGNPLNFRWPPQNGFYAIVGGQLQTPDPKTAVTVSHVSVYATNPPSNIVYYVHSSNLKNGIYVSGLGAYDANNGDWNVFPAASFDGSQEDDGVAAVSDGAWFTADSVCSLGKNAWNGVCLGRFRILGAWGISPGLNLPSIATGTGGGFGVLPQNVHSGPFDAYVSGKGVCSVDVNPESGSQYTFTVHGTGRGVCPITLTNKYDGSTLPLVTVVSSPSPPAR